MRTIRIWNEQGQDPVSIAVGFQSARERGNIFQDGLGTWLVPSRKQAHKALTKQTSDPLSIVIGSWLHRWMGLDFENELGARPLRPRARGLWCRLGGQIQGSNNRCGEQL